MSADPEFVTATAWPSTEAEATAERLMIHAARSALIHQAVGDLWMRRMFDAERGTDEYTRAARRWHESTTTFLGYAQIGRTFQQLRRLMTPESANEIARDLWACTEDGGVLVELCWDYLNDAGLDAQAINEWAETLAAEHVQRITDREATR